MRIQFVVLTLCAALAPAQAHAGWFAAPLIGAAFPGSVTESPKLQYGGALGWMGSVWGIEVELGHRLDFFKAADVPDFILSDSSVTTRG